MTSRRIISSEKTILDKDDEDLQSSSGTGEQSSTAPAVPMDVIIKLLAFTLAMIVIPIGSYFVTINTIFGGNSTYAGALAAILANVVLVGYVIVAMNEDQSDQLEAEKKKKQKERQGKAE
ncbi:vacuolar ATPase assembly integral membrane protein VMA21 [Xylaria flabelliformis]|nr:vacuolar ATPase assembly integral membrane protein VMA21 [Xylaria flabelliformis]